jgi:hypothetical protein
MKKKEEEVYFLQPVSKPDIPQICHSERSEESCLFKYLSPFASLRVTEKRGFEMASKDSVCYRSLAAVVGF